MQCPFCKEEFAEGYLASGSSRISWLAEEPYAFGYPPRRGGFLCKQNEFLAALPYEIVLLQKM